MSKTSTIGSAKSSMKRKNSIWHALPYIAPHFIIFAVFGIIPIIFGIGLAFTRWNMVGAPKFVGLQNFAKIFDPSTYFYSIFWRDLGHTLLFVLVSVPLTIIVPLLLAVALSKKGLKGAGLFQAIFYIPGLISIAAGALVWRMVFNSQFGLLNTTFHTDINWLGKNPYAWITIFVLVLWAGIGGNLVIYRSALSGVDESLYEAAKVDGAGPVRIFFSITLPEIKLPLFYTTIMTTTGFATVDFSLWPTFCRMALVMMMFTGACAGSTAGGIKLSRILILCKSLKRELKRLAHPNHVSVVKMDGQGVEERVVSAAGSFLTAYLLVLLVGALVVSWDNFGFQESFAASLTCISNVGPGLGILGPMENFSILSPLSKVVLSVEMLMGRLELMPLMALLLRSTWRD